LAWISVAVLWSSMCSWSRLRPFTEALPRRRARGSGTTWWRPSAHCGGGSGVWRVGLKT
jgi:hypothetical protein